MKQWEYKVVPAVEINETVVVHDDGYSNLNRLGNNGWELVAVQKFKKDWLAFFKREVSDV